MANPNGNPKNLKPFQPGHPGMGGRPRKRPLTEAYDELLRSLLPEQERKQFGLPKGTTWADAIARARGRAALRVRGVEDSKELREATEGRAMQRIEFAAGVTDHTPEFVVVYATPIPGARSISDFEQPQLPEKAIDVEPEKDTNEP